MPAEIGLPVRPGIREAYPAKAANSPTSAPPSTTSDIGIELADEAGIVRPDWDLDVELEVTGPGELLGLGSGRADTTE